MIRINDNKDKNNKDYLIRINDNKDKNNKDYLIINEGLFRIVNNTIGIVLC